jgi:hypothetical protein
MPEADYESLLDHHLGDAYRIHVLGHQADAAVRQLKEHLQADGHLQRAAARRLQERYTDAVCKRDFISRTHRELLTAALAKGTT